MRKILVIIFSSFIFSGLTSVLAQSVASIKADRENFIWGEGSATTLDKAKKVALDMLVNQISGQVESKYDQTIKEENNVTKGGGSFSEKVFFKERFLSLLYSDLTEYKQYLKLIYLSSVFFSLNFVAHWG